MNATQLNALVSRLCDESGKLKTFGKFMGDLSKDSPKWDGLKKEYNEGKEALHKYLRESSDDSTLRLRLVTSLISPEKHGAITAAGFLTGSVAYQAAEETRKRKSKAFWDGMNAKQLPEEMGLTDKEFWTLARHNGFVTPDWKRTTATGSQAFTAAAEAAWLKHYKQSLIADRQAAAIAEAAAAEKERKAADRLKKQEAAAAEREAKRKAAETTAETVTEAAETEAAKEAA